MKCFDVRDLRERIHPIWANDVRRDREGEGPFVRAAGPVGAIDASGENRLSCDLERLAHLLPPELPIERRSAHPQQLGGMLLVTAGCLDGAGNVRLALLVQMTL